MIKCYVCGFEKFDVFLQAQSEVSVIEDKPIIYETIKPTIQTILCAQCGVIQYCGERTDAPWFTHQVALEYDITTKTLSRPSRSDKVTLAMLNAANIDYDKLIELLSESKEKTENEEV